MSRKKNIVVTGAARGIGRATARHLALLGHSMFLIDIDTEELSYTATSHIPGALAGRANGTQKRVLVDYGVCDLRDPEAITATIKAAADFFGGRIDVLVNNAGIARAQFSGGRSMAEPLVLDEWQAYMETNLTAPFLVSQACIPYMKTEDFERAQAEHSVIRPEAIHAASRLLSEEDRSRLSKRERQGPCIINIASFRALQSEPNCEGYAASKGGILGLTQAMAISCAQWGIRCNAILPGYIYVEHECKAADGASGNHWWAKGVPADRHRKHPTGRVGCGEDVAETTEWLMGAGFVTGQEIVVDGGVSKIKHVDA